MAKKHKAALNNLLRAASRYAGGKATLDETLEAFSDPALAEAIHAHPVDLLPAADIIREVQSAAKVKWGNIPEKVRDGFKYTLGPTAGEEYEKEPPKDESGYWPKGVSERWWKGIHGEATTPRGGNRSALPPNTVGKGFGRDNGKDDDSFRAKADFATKVPSGLVAGEDSFLAASERSTPGSFDLF